MKQKLINLSVVILLSGCGIADHFTAQSKMNQAEQDYRKCLSANTAKPDSCQPLKDVWESDKAAYQSGAY